MQHHDLIDATFLIKTPENIAFRYSVAGPFRRLPAFFLDIVIKATIFVIFSIITAFLGGFTGSGGLAMMILLIAWFLLDWFYGGFFEAYFNGQSPGKMLLGLRVLTTEGQPINGLQAVMRNILRGADFFPACPLFGLIAMTMNHRYQRLGDLVCGTMVVIEERPWLTGMAKFDDPRAIQLASFIPPNFAVSRTLAKALATYVERRRFFAVPRRREMARHIAAPLLERFGLPADTSYDLLLCALYYRTFVADRADDERHLQEARQANPFVVAT